MARRRGVEVDEKEMLPVSQAAKELELSEKTLRKLIRTGELPAYKLTERKTLVERGDLEAFKSSRRVSPSKVEEQ